MKTDLALLKENNLTNISIVKDIENTAKCNCCNKMYNPKKSVVGYTNYGGQNRELKYCSNNCLNEVINIFGDRISKQPLRPVFLWNRR